MATPRCSVGMIYVLLALIAVAVPLSATDFSAAVNYATGNMPNSVAVGDFNGDGKPDIAITNFGDGNVTVFLGTGAGTFPPTGVNYSAGGSNPDSVVVADVNHDGKQDLILALKASNAVAVLLGNGDGTFQSAVTFAAGSAPLAVAVGDFNGDGKLDLAVANQSDTFNILLGNGDGTFGAPTLYILPGFATSIVAGDFNGDGRTDLAVGTQTGVSVFLGNGDGSFQSGQSVSSTYCYGIAVGDLNGDGKLDLVLGGSTNLSVLLGNGNGSFQAPANYALAGVGYAVVIADVNADGKPDLLVAKGVSVSMLLGNGDGTFLTPVDFLAGAPQALAAGDFNLDGRPDVVAVGPGRNQASVLLNNVLPNPGGLSFLAAANHATGASPFSVAVADFNGDGKPDLAVANFGGTFVSVLLGNGGGTFQSPVNYTTAFSPASVAAGDVNGDGKPDLIVANNGSNNVTVLLGNGNGTFQAPVYYPVGSHPISVALADFNGDGKLDIVVANSYDNNVSVLLGNGDGTFQAAVNYATAAGPSSVTVADVNGDGRPDLIVANYGASRVAVLLGNGNGTFQPATLYLVGIGPNSVVLGDFNGDGKLDIATANANGNNVSVLLGNGDGTFRAAVNYLVGTNPLSLIAGDFNGDGKLDLAVANNISNNVAVLLGNGDGTFKTAVPFAADATPQFVTAADVNSDGKPDLVVGNSNSGDVSVLLNAGGTMIATSASPSATLFGESVTFTATMAPTLATVVPTGTIQFLDNGAQIGINTLDGTGVATYTTPALAAGAHSITAQYSGDGAYWANTAVRINYSVNQAGSSTALSSSLNPAAPGSSVTFTATVNAQAPGAGIPSGTVTFKDGSTTVGTGTLSLSGVVSFSTAALLPGTHSVTAVYAGDTNFSGSVSAALNQTISQATTTTTVTSSLNPSTYGGNVTFTATVSGAAGTPTGTVTFLDGANAIGSSNLNAGAATLLISTLSGGSHSITAVYSGDANDSASTSAAITQTVNPIASSTTLSGSASSSYGQGVTFTASVNSTAGLPTGTVTFKDGATVLGTASLVNSGETYQTAVNYTASAGSGGIAVGDFKGRGLLDVAVAAQQTNKISVLLNNGSGGYGAPATYTVGSNPTSIVAADVNGDGKLDLIVLNSGSATVSVLLGNGDGTFQTAKTSSAAGAAFNASMAVGDLNNDGKLDIVVANFSSSNNVSVLLGNGDGTFQAPVTYAAGNYPRAVAVADFNGDGKLDILVANANPLNVTNGTTIGLLLGNGDGTFQAQQVVYTFAGNWFPISIAVGDFNGDGLPDFAVALNAITYAYAFLNTSAHPGQFIFDGSVAVGTAPVSIVAADLNGDGKTDLAVVNANSAGANGSVTALIGNGGGAFTPSSYNVGVNPSAVAVGKVNAGSTADLVVANASNANSISVLPGVAVAQANFAINDLSVGSHSLTASYGGDNSFNGSTSSAYAETVIKGTATIPPTYQNGSGGLIGGLISSKWPNADLGLPLTLTATVTGGGATPTGTVTFVNWGTNTIGTANLVNGVATLTTVATASTPLNTGQNSIVATYGGDANYNGTSSAALNQWIYWGTATTISSSSNPSTFGSSVTFTAHVTSNYGTPTGTVTFSDGGMSLGSATLSGGYASLTTSAVAAGTRSIVVSYPTTSAGGTNQFNASSSGPLAQVVSKGSTTTTVTSTPNPSAWNAPVTLTATVTPQIGGTVTGKVQFRDSGASIGWGMPVPAGTFKQVVAFPTAGTSDNSMVNGIVVGDFNGDGNLDVATANNDTNNISVMLGDGNGGFSAPVNYSTAGGPLGIIAGDFNGDGKLDLAVSNGAGSASSVTVFLGNGNGTFQPGVNYATGNFPKGIGVGDFNGDGKLDIVTADYYGRDVSVLLGNGDGTFRAAISNPGGAYGLFAIAAGDFDGDGKLDVVVTDTDHNQVGIMLGNGDGTLRQPIAWYATGQLPMAVAAADLNGDGKLDVALTTYFGYTLQVGLGNGDGTVSTWNTYATGSNYPAGVAVADFNGDGKPDLAVAVNAATMLFSGNGNGTFQPGVVYNDIGGIPNAIAIGDFNGDGLPDAVTATNGGSFGLHVLNGTGQWRLTTSALAAGAHAIDAAYQGDSNFSGSTSTPLTQTVSGAALTLGLTCTEVTYDGNSHSCTGSATGVGGVAVSGSWSFNPAIATNAGSYPVTGTFTSSDPNYAGGTAIGTLNIDKAIPTVYVGCNESPYDGTPHSCTAQGVGAGGTLGFLCNGIVGYTNAGTYLETATCSGNSENYNPGTGSGTLTIDPALITASVTAANKTYDGTNTADIIACRLTSVIAGDTNNVTCTAAAATFASNNIGASITVTATGITLGGSASGNYSLSPTTANTTASIFAPLAIRLSDFDGDHKADLAWHNDATGDTQVWRMNGTTVNGSMLNMAIPDTTWRPMLAADFNGDGKADLLWHDSSTNADYLWMTNSSLWFDGYPLEPVNDSNWQIIAAADFDGDGKADLVWRNSQTGDNYVWLMNGSTMKAPAWMQGVAGTDWQFVTIADFNGDGKPDMLWHNVTTGVYYAWLMNGTTIVSGAVPGTINDPNWQIAAIADFNGDGRAEILWRNITTGANYMWLLDSNGNFASGAGVEGVTDMNWQIVGVGDLDGDGKADLVWRNTSTGENYVWFMDGATLVNSGGIPAKPDQSWKLY